MKAYIFSLILSAFGATFVYFFTSNEMPADSQVRVSSNGKDGHARLKSQLAHARVLAPTDLLEVPTIYPLAKPDDEILIGSPFGMRFHPVHHVNKMHKGLDFVAPKGTPVLATASGEVEKAVYQGNKEGYGRHIVIKHDEAYEGEQYSTLYAHLSSLRVKQGEYVMQGDTIGFSGNTGTSTAPHLHYEVHLNGDHVDPLEYLHEVSFAGF
ncbi:MAG: peptidoglycan DD-metalloendopeptidase family protein [Bacteroidota bacterium]